MLLPLLQLMHSLCLLGKISTQMLKKFAALHLISQWGKTPHFEGYFLTLSQHSLDDWALLSSSSPSCITQSIHQGWLLPSGFKNTFIFLFVQQNKRSQKGMIFQPDKIKVFNSYLVKTC